MHLKEDKTFFTNRNYCFAEGIIIYALLHKTKTIIQITSPNDYNNFYISQ